MGLSAPLASTASFNAPEIGVELSCNSAPRQTFLDSNDAETVISLVNVRFGWASSDSASETTDSKHKLALNIQGSRNGSLIMIAGPTGSGKSTFLKGLAGEVPLAEGEMFVRYPDMAFCEQTTWLASTSIRDNIIGGTPVLDEEWYAAVVRACALEADLEMLPQGNSTLVGSKGVKLSGGQKQRIVSGPRGQE